MHGMSLRHRPSGFTLIEVMITVFVVAVGLLSVAGLQAFAKKSNFDAIQRTQAAALAQDLIERIRANAAQGAGYVTDASAGWSSSNAPGAPTQSCSTSSTASSPACTPAQVVAFDKYQWTRALFGAAESLNGESAGGLSEPTACITNATAPCGAYTIAIAWRGITPLPPADSSDTANPANNRCGSGNAAYDDIANPGTDTRLRRVIVVRTVIDDHSGRCAGVAP